MSAIRLVCVGLLGNTLDFQSYELGDRYKEFRKVHIICDIWYARYHMPANAWNFSFVSQILVSFNFISGKFYVLNDCNFDLESLIPFRISRFFTFTVIFFIICRLISWFYEIRNIFLKEVTSERYLTLCCGSWLNLK